MRIVVLHTLGPESVHADEPAMAAVVHVHDPLAHRVVAYRRVEAVASLNDRAEWRLPVDIDIRIPSDVDPGALVVSVTVYIAVAADDGGAGLEFDGTADVALSDAQRGGCTDLVNRLGDDCRVVSRRGSVLFVGPGDNGEAAARGVSIRGIVPHAAHPEAARLAEAVSRRRHPDIPAGAGGRFMQLPHVAGVHPRDASSDADFMRAMANVSFAMTQRGFLRMPVGMYINGPAYELAANTLHCDTLESALHLALLQYGLRYDDVVPASARCPPARLFAIGAAIARYYAAYMPYVADQIAKGRKGTTGAQWIDLMTGPWAALSGDCDKRAYGAAHVFTLLAEGKFRGECGDSDMPAFLGRLRDLFRRYWAFVSFVVVRQRDSRLSDGGVVGHAVCILLHEDRVRALLGVPVADIPSDQVPGAIVDTTVPVEPDMVRVARPVPLPARPAHATLSRTPGFATVADALCKYADVQSPRPAPDERNRYLGVSHLLPVHRHIRAPEMRKAFGMPDGVFTACVVIDRGAYGADPYRLIGAATPAGMRMLPITNMTEEEYARVRVLSMYDPPAWLPPAAADVPTTERERRAMQDEFGVPDSEAREMQWLTHGPPARHCVISAFITLENYRAKSATRALVKQLKALPAATCILAPRRMHPHRVALHILLACPV